MVGRNPPQTGRRVAMTCADLAATLDPPVTAEQLMRIFAQLPGLNPVGSRPTGRPGPPYLTYDVDEVMEWHAANARWLVIPPLTGEPP